ncbi:MAG: GntR family transcriptional regulator [Anaerolineales bacterium]|nr:GntR family transcriptional regulator [Anaerolineales bacterium]
MSIDFRSKIPIYIQIVEQVKQQVAASGLQPGEQLPTVRQLAADLRVNFNTIARAYRLLDEAGLISTQQGRGTYVVGTPPDTITGALRLETLRTLARLYLTDAARLGLTPDEVASVTIESIERWRQLGIPPAEADPA